MATEYVQAREEEDIICKLMQTMRSMLCVVHELVKNKAHGASGEGGGGYFLKNGEGAKILPKVALQMTYRFALASIM
jgi:hypothetical protein